MTKQEQYELRKQDLIKRLDERLLPQDITYKIRGDYITHKTTLIHYRCNLCGYEAKVKAYSIIDPRRDSGCKRCQDKERGLRARTPIEVVNTRIIEASQGRYKFTVTRFNSLVDSDVRCRCNINRSHTWVTTCDNLIRSKTGCPQCGLTSMATKVGKQLQAPLDVIALKLHKELTPKGIFFVVDLDKYRGVSSRCVWCYCEKHDHQWTTRPDTLLGNSTHKGQGCFWCGRDLSARKLKANEIAIRAKLDIVAKAQGFTYTVDTYKNSHQKIECRCNKKGHIWQRTICDILYHQRGCPDCVFTNGSQQEKDLLDFIKSLTDQEIIENSRRIIPPMEIDIYIPSLRLAFEYNGTYFHSDEVIAKKRKFQTAQQYHDYKTQACAKQGIRLVHIGESEWVHNRLDVKHSIMVEINNAVMSA